MTTGKLIAGIAAGAVVALLSIPKTRKMITCSLSDFADSVKSHVGHSNNNSAKRKSLAVS